MHSTPRMQSTHTAMVLAVFLSLTSGLDAQDYIPRSPRVPPHASGFPSTQYGPRNQPLVPGEFAPPNTVVPGAPYNDSHGLITHRRISDKEYWGERQLDVSVRRAMHGASFRFDYLNWSTDEPGEHVLGAPTALTNDPNAPFQVVDRSTGNNLTLPAILPQSDTMTLNNANGVRGVLSLPVGDDSFEINGWVLAQATDELNLLRPDNVYVATTTFTNNQVFTSSTNYDQFHAVLESQMWGAGVNYIFGDPMSTSPWKFKPLIGFRYMNFQEEFNQFGRVVIPDPNVANIGEVSSHAARIHSRTTNNLYGPSAGVELVFEQPWFSFSIVPKVTLGLNDYSMVVRSTGIVAADDPITFDEEEHVDFAMMFQVGAYFQIHATENITIFAGYDLLFASHVTRPVENIFYNEERVTAIGAGLTTQGDVRLTRTITDIATQGLTVGIVFRLP